jgi:hypothetical protein
MIFEGIAKGITKVVSVVKWLMNGQLSIYLAYIFIILILFVLIFYWLY